MHISVGDAIKPMRSNHCGICKKCVLKMDHHCPWVNTCVGWKNQRHFILFIFYLFVGACFFLLMEGNMLLFLQNDRPGGPLGHVTDQAHSISLIMCVSASLASLLFGSWTFFLSSVNLTTIEFASQPGRVKCGLDRGPFHLGFRRNLREVFGLNATWYNWFLPSWANPPGNGMVYPQNDGSSHDLVEVIHS